MKTICCAESFSALSHWSETPARIPNRRPRPGPTSIVNEERKRRAGVFEPTRSIVDKRSWAIPSERRFAPVTCRNFSGMTFLYLQTSRT